MSHLIKIYTVCKFSYFLWYELTHLLSQSNLTSFANPLSTIQELPFLYATLQYQENIPKGILSFKVGQVAQERVFDDNFSYFSWKPYILTPHLNRLDKTVQMRGQNICFYAELAKIIPYYHQIPSLI